MTDNELLEAMAQYYIAPAVTEGSHFYKIFLTYHPTIQLANMHAYKTVYALREIAEEIIYFPYDILTNEESADVIVESGFSILIRTRESGERIRKIVRPGYDLADVTVEECDEDTFKHGFTDLYPEVRMQRVLDAINEENVRYAPGDFVIFEREPGKARLLAKDRMADAPKEPQGGMDVCFREQLTEAVRKLITAQTAVLNSPDLDAPELSLDHFKEAAERLTRVTGELLILVNSLHE